MKEIVKKRIEELSELNEGYKCEFVKEGDSFRSAMSYYLPLEDIDIHLSECTDIQFTECINITEDDEIMFGTVTLLEAKDEVKEDLKILIDIIDHYEGYFYIFTDEDCVELHIAHFMSFDKFWDFLSDADEEDINDLAEVIYGKATVITFKLISAIKGLAENECSFEDAVKFVVQFYDDSEESEESD